MFESWYFSPLNHPGAAWLSAAIMLAVVLRKLPFFWAFVVGALAVTVADATVTGAWSKLGGESHVAFPVLSFFFVLFGDWRLYLFNEKYAKGVGTQDWIISGSLAVTPSLVVWVIGQFAPNAFENPRWLYLTYELIFIALATSTYFLRIRPSATPERSRWLASVNLFFLVGYCGWAISDMLILSGFDVGHALRIVPNVMYYAGFIPVVFFAAPDKERDWKVVS